MNGKQQAVMWMGLTLIILRLFTTSQWKDIWGTILKGSGGKSSSGGGGFDPLNPIPGGGIPGLIFGINDPNSKPATKGVANA